jgi:hypothetical protein
MLKHFNHFAFVLTRLFTLYNLQAAYEEYFSWRKNYEMYERYPLCMLCEKLHNPNEPWQTYEDAYDWWYMDEKEDFVCQEGYSRHYFHAKDDIITTERMKGLEDYT